MEDNLKALEKLKDPFNSSFNRLVDQLAILTAVIQDQYKEWSVEGEKIELYIDNKEKSDSKMPGDVSDHKLALAMEMGEDYVFEEMLQSISPEVIEESNPCHTRSAIGKKSRCSIERDDEFIDINAEIPGYSIDQIMKIINIDPSNIDEVLQEGEHDVSDFGADMPCAEKKERLDFIHKGENDHLLNPSSVKLKQVVNPYTVDSLFGKMMMLIFDPGGAWRPTKQLAGKEFTVNMLEIMQGRENNGIRWTIDQIITCVTVFTCPLTTQRPFRKLKIPQCHVLLDCIQTLEFQAKEVEIKQGGKRMASIRYDCVYAAQFLYNYMMLVSQVVEGFTSHHQLLSTNVGFITKQRLICWNIRLPFLGDRNLNKVWVVSYMESKLSMLVGSLEAKVLQIDVSTGVHNVCNFEAMIPHADWDGQCMIHLHRHSLLLQISTANRVGSIKKNNCVKLVRYWEVGCARSKVIHELMNSMLAAIDDNLPFKYAGDIKELLTPAILYVKNVASLYTTDFHFCEMFIFDPGGSQNHGMHLDGNKFTDNAFVVPIMLHLYSRCIEVCPIGDSQPFSLHILLMPPLPQNVEVFEQESHSIIGRYSENQQVRKPEFIFGYLSRRTLGLKDASSQTKALKSRKWRWRQTKALKSRKWRLPTVLFETKCFAHENV